MMYTYEIFMYIYVYRDPCRYFVTGKSPSSRSEGRVLLLCAPDVSRRQTCVTGTKAQREED